MDILSKTDDEIFEIAKPIWDNLVRSSNLKDYGGFTKDFSTQMLFGANEVELGKQWANNKIITNLKETFEPFGCLRRGIHITVLIKVVLRFKSLFIIFMLENCIKTVNTPRA